MAQRARKRRGLANWLADATTPLFVLDAKRKVLFFNHGCEQLTGWGAGDVIGQVCDYVSEPDGSKVESLTGSLCPPPEVYEGREQEQPTYLLDKRGDKRAWLLRFVPLTTDEGTVDRVLGMIVPLPAPTGKRSTSPDRQLHADLAAIRVELRKRYDVTSLVGRSAVFRRILTQVELAQASAASVQFVGMTGTGREHIARIIHHGRSDRRGRPSAFVPLNCDTLTSDELAETLERLFSQSRETEAGQLPPGTLPPGTLYLRHVDRLPADLQQRLVTFFGTDDPSGVDLTPPSLWLMSDSLQPLETAVAADTLRAECYEQLTSLIITIPPLQERPEDLPLLAVDMLEQLNRHQETQVTGFTEEVWSAFRRYHWPGNQAELQQVIREAREQCGETIIGEADLPFRFRTGQQAQRVSPASPVELMPLQQRLAEVERQHILSALQQCGHNKSRTAGLLGITRPKLYRRMEELGIDESTG